MSISFLIMFFFGISILISWMGLGTLINYLIFPKNMQDIWLRTGWGLCLTLFIGGIMNITGIISPTLVFLLIGFGNIVFLTKVYLIKEKIWVNIKGLVKVCGESHILILFLLVNFLLLLTIYSGSISNIHFNWGDDFHAYFVFPKKMLQTGSLGLDPFSEQRILMLGGMSFLHAIILSLGDFRNLNMIDVGLGTILTTGLLYGLSREFNLLKWMNLLVIFIALIIVPLKVNISSLVIGLALFITLFRTLWVFRENKINYISKSIIISLVISALTSLKTNFIITLVGFLLLTYFFYFAHYKNNRKNIIKEIFLVCTFTVLFILPWSVANYQSNGTLLYPIFGNGFHNASWLQFNSEISVRGILNSMKSIYLNMNSLPLIFFFLIFYIFGNTVVHDKQKNIASMFVASISTPLIIVLLSGGYGWDRFSWSAITASTLILLIVVFARIDSSRRLIRLMRVYIVLFGICLIVINNKTKLVDYYASYISSISTGLKNHKIIVKYDDKIYNSIDEQIEQRYLCVQHSIPENEIVLERTQYPFLFDFKRNNIYITHFLGASSLPPGMPFFNGGDVLAEYLLKQSIRYVVYSYKSEANFKYEDYLGLLSDNVTPFIKAQARYTFDFHKNIEELRENIKPIYDDGEIFVLDLESVSTK